MEKIPTVSTSRDDAGLQERVGSTINLANHTTKKVVRSLVSYGGLIISIVIVLVFLVAMTTRMRSVPPEDIGAYAGEIIMNWLFYCISATMVYIACSDSGLRAGKTVPEYNETMARYIALRKKLIENKYQKWTAEFCLKLCKEEQVTTRTTILANFSIDYDTYEKCFEGKDAEQLAKEYPKLTKLQIKTIEKANAVSMIVLTPEMIMRTSERMSKRAFLGTNPEKKKTINIALRVARITVMSACMAFLVVDMIVEPTWATFAESLVKALMITVQGFMGYKFGYDHITVTCVNYASDQADLIQQLISYCEGKNGEVSEPIYITKDEEPAGIEP